MKTKRAQGLYKLAALVRHEQVDDGLEPARELKPWDDYWVDFWEDYWENYWDDYWDDYWEGYWDNFWEGFWQEDQF